MAGTRKALINLLDRSETQERGSRGSKKGLGAARALQVVAPL